MDLIKTDFLIIGAGVIGLSIARQLALNSYKTVLIEKNSHIGDETSARNSGVIHAGFYYPLGSLKSRLCNSGNKLIYDYCKSRNIFVKNIKKILVTNNVNDLKIFEEYIKNAEEIGGEKLNILDSKKIMKLEPNLKTKFGLFSPESGILDTPSYINSLEKDLLDSNGIISKNSVVKKVQSDKKGFISIIETNQEEFLLRSNKVIFSIGLFSNKIKDIFPEIDGAHIKKINFTKGHYFKLSGKSPFNHLIYPMPTKFSLGIHSSPDLSGAVRFGPDAVKVSKIDYSFERNVKNKFIDAISEYWPDIHKRQIHEDFVGIRPKIQDDKMNFHDFDVLFEDTHGIKNLFLFQGIESPGLTCSLSMADWFVEQINRM